MNRILRTYLLIFLAAILPFFTRQNPLYEEGGRPSSCSFAALSEGTLLPYGLTAGSRDDESYKPQSGSVSLRRWKKTDSAFVYLQELSQVIILLVCPHLTDQISDKSDSFSALFLSGGTYDRKLVPRSNLLS